MNFEGESESEREVDALTHEVCSGSGQDLFHPIPIVWKRCDFQARDIHSLNQCSIASMPAPEDKY